MELGHRRGLSPYLVIVAILAIFVGACSGTTATPAPSASGAATPSSPTAASTAPSTAPTAATTAAPSAAATAAQSAGTTAAPSAAATPAPSAGTAGYTLEPGKSGGTFTGAWVGPCCVSVDAIAPLTASGDGLFVSKIWEHLVTYSINTETNNYGEIIPALAASWETSSDGLTWTFHLQPGVKWHDGTDFTAADVKFSLEACVNPKTGGCGYSSIVSGIVGAKELAAGTGTDLPGVTTPDPLTVVIKTVAPDAPFLDSMTSVWIIQQLSVSKIPLDGNVSKNPYWTAPGQAMGTGPFKITGYQQGVFMELSRFDDYWRGTPNLEKIIRKEYKDSATALLALDKGEVDLAYVTADEVAREEGNTSVRVITGASGVDNIITFNPLINPVFAKLEFRQAMMHAVDRQTIIDTLYNGKGTVQSCFYGSPAYHGLEETYPYDPEKAKAILAAAGIDLTTLPEFTFDTYYTDPLSLNVMTLIQKNWADVGFKVKIQQMDGAAWVKKYYDDAKSEVSFSGTGSGPDGNVASTYFLSTAAYPAGYNGWVGYSYKNDEVDRLINEGKTTFDPQQRIDIYKQLCKVLADDLPWNVLWQTTRYWAVSNRIGNFFIAVGGGGYYDAAEHWFVR